MYRNRFTTLCRSFFQDQSGVTAVEYGLIAALIAVAIIISIGSVGISINTLFTNVAECFNSGACVF
jgi:pilus assembly protein Flp/PilA